MLDKWFMSKMNKTGKVLYFVGQFILIGLWLLVFFKVLDMDWDQQSFIFILGIIPIIVIWGVICMKVWPADGDQVAAVPAEGKEQTVSAGSIPKSNDPFGPHPGMK